MRTFALLCASLLLLATAVLAEPRAATQPAAPITLNFSGWRISPAGAAHAQVGDMPLKMVLSPDGKTLAAVSGGFKTGLALIDVPTRRVRQFINITRCWNGVAFSHDGKHIYVSGGNSNDLYVFDVNADGTAKLA